MNLFLATPKRIIYKVYYRLFLFLMLISAMVSCGVSGDDEQSEETRMKSRMKEAAGLMMDGESDKALEIYRHVVRENPDKMSLKTKDALVLAYSNMGYILYFCNQDYIGSFDALISGKNIAEKLPNCKYLPEIYLNLGNVYGIYGDRRLSQHYFVMAFDEALYRQKWEVLLTTVYNFLNMEMSGELTREGRLRLDKFRHLNIPDHPMLPVIRGFYEVYSLNKQGNSREALRILQKVKEMPTNSLTPERIWNLCNLYALRIAVKGNLKNEQDFYARTLEASVDSVDADFQSMIYGALASYFSQRGDQTKSLYNSRKYMEIRDSVFSIPQYSLIHDIHLQKEKKIHDMELALEKEKEQKWFWWFIVAVAYLLVLVAAVVIVVRQNRNLKIRNKELCLRYVGTQKLEDELVELRKNSEIPALATSAGCDSEESPADADVCDSGTQDENSESAEEIQEERQLADHLKVLAGKIVGIMNDENEVTLKDFSLDKLAKLTESNRNYVSQVINTIYKKNFNAVLGEARVKIACRKLSSSGPFRNMTVEALANEVGFKSRSNFVVVFKKITGLTPSEYRRSAEL